jgi:threonine aldolase
MDKIIDLRSDTVTRPSKEMRAIMADAEVGDDVYGEDPTINKLQDLVANLLKKEAALFVSSGTMGNQLCLKSHTEPGDEIIVERNAHIFQYETAAPSIISNIQIFPVPGKYGMMKLQDIEDSIRPDIYYYPKTRLICLENTHNKAGGTILDLDYIKDVRTLANLQGLKMHLDGARLWNASIETGIKLEDYSQYFDSISLCLSKGLGAPVGSVIAGTKPFIEKARKFRKILGGGLRQAGILAAAGIYAIQNNFEKLAADHRRAKELGKSLKELDCIDIDLESVQTNMVIFGFKNKNYKFIEKLEILKNNNLLANPNGKDKIRLVTHLDIDDNDIDRAINLMKKVFSN